MPRNHQMQNNHIDMELLMIAPDEPASKLGFALRSLQNVPSQVTVSNARRILPRFDNLALAKAISVSSVRRQCTRACMQPRLLASSGHCAAIRDASLLKLIINWSANANADAHRAAPCQYDGMIEWRKKGKLASGNV